MIGEENNILMWDELSDPDSEIAVSGKEREWEEWTIFQRDANKDNSPRFADSDHLGKCCFPVGDMFDSAGVID